MGKAAACSASTQDCHNPTPAKSKITRDQQSNLEYSISWMPNALRASATSLALLRDTETKLIIQICVASEYIYVLLQSLPAYEY